MNVNYRIQKTAILAVALLWTIAVCGVQAPDYVTEEEEDLIRDAQTVEARAAVYLKFLDNRIVALGLRERTAKEREQTKKEIADYQNESKIAAKIKGAEVKAKPVDPGVYLRNTTKAELLRGYMQIIDETMDYIDDAFERHLDVRPAVENLEKFLQEQLPRFQKLETETASEASALKSTIAHSERSIEAIHQALQSLPKMERVPTKSK